MMLALDTPMSLVSKPHVFFGFSIVLMSSTSRDNITYFLSLPSFSNVVGPSGPRGTFYISALGGSFSVDILLYF